PAARRARPSAPWSGPLHRVVAARLGRGDDEHRGGLIAVVSDRPAVIGIQARERACRRRVLLAVDHDCGGALEHEEQLLLVSFGLVVLGYRLAGRELDEVHAKAVALQRAAHEAPIAGALELVRVGDRVRVLVLHRASAPRLLGIAAVVVLKPIGRVGARGAATTTRSGILPTRAGGGGTPACRRG